MGVSFCSTGSMVTEEEILEQSGNEWNNQENQKNSSDFSDSDTIQDNSDINATENGVDAEKQMIRR